MVVVGGTGGEKHGTKREVLLISGGMESWFSARSMPGAAIGVFSRGTDTLPEAVWMRTQKEPTRADRRELFRMSEASETGPVGGGVTGFRAPFQEPALFHSASIALASGQ